VRPTPELEVKGEPVAADATVDDVTVEPAVDDTQELFQTAQTTEATTQRSVEDAPKADEAEVQTHAEHPGEENIPPEKK
jgi:hypothetical protein